MAKQSPWDYDQRIPKKRKWEYCLAFVALLQTMAVAVFHLRKSGLQQPEPMWTDCGLSPNEARSRNCHFDHMLYAWIPDECYYEEPLQEYSPFEDRTWYRDINLTQVLTPSEMEELAAGNMPKAYTQTFHHEHCLYALRKLAMAVDKRWLLIDGKSATLHHSVHCERQIAHFVKGVVDQTYSITHNHAAAHLQYPGCVALPWRI